MSKVSGSYRAITEPYLYQDIVFESNQGFRLYRLLATLLERRNLAAYIETITLRNSTSELPIGYFPYRDDLYARLLSHMNEVQTLIQSLAMDVHADAVNPSREVWSWICSVYQGMHLKPIYGGTLSLLICMATNLKCLDFGYHISPGTDWVLAHDWHKPDSKEPVPLHKLEFLRVQNETIVPPSHALKTFHLVRNIYNDAVGHEALNTSCITMLPSNLRVLKLEDVCFAMNFMEAAISAPNLANLQELIVTHAARPSTSRPWRNYDFSRLSNLLIRHIPQLKVLEWSYMVWDVTTGVGPFGRLNALEDLVSLTVDAGLLHGNNMDDLNFFKHLVQPQTYMPPNLQNLHVTNIQIDGVWSIYHMVPRPIEKTVAFILGLVDMLPLHSIDVSFVLDSVLLSLSYAELPRRVRDLLPPLVAALHKKGVTMTAWRKLRNKDSKILYAPGITVPFPHLADISQGEWDIVTRLLWEIKTGKKQRPNGLRSLDDTHPDELTLPELLYSEEFDEVIETDVAEALESKAKASNRRAVLHHRDGARQT